MDQITLDFENGKVVINSDNQNGEIHCPDLKKRKANILAAMGFQTFNIIPIVTAYEEYLSGKIDREELDLRLDRFLNEEGSECGEA